MATSSTTTKTKSRVPHVVIVGGGFAGLYAARLLGRASHKSGQRTRVTLLDRRNHHLFQPLLYQVATAALSAGEIAVPIRAILSRYRNVQVLLGEVTGVDVDKKSVQLADGETVDYDYLVLASGAQTAYFGHDDWAAIAPGLKSVEDALDIRRRLLCAFEAAERMELDSKDRRELLTFVVVGGGPTGVEMAGAIAEISKKTLKHDFRTIDTTHTRVILVQSGDRVLGEYPPELSASAQRQLENLGVEVKLGPRVTDIDPGKVVVGTEEIYARTIIWTAGVSASPLGKTLNVPIDKAGRVIVNPDMSIPGHEEVFVCGDLSHYAHQTGEPLPGLSPVAIKQGERAAKNILADMAGAERKKFKFLDKGAMATIGRASAVANIFNRVQLSGFLAWISWLFVHVYFLIGFYNRIIVMFRWGWAYCASNRGARLITGGVCASGESDPDIAAEVVDRPASSDAKPFDAESDGSGHALPTPAKGTIHGHQGTVT
jgi:NADH dehydrogenase